MRRSSVQTLLWIVVAGATAAVCGAWRTASDDPPFSPITVVDGLKTFPGGLAALPEHPAGEGAFGGPAVVALGRHLFFDPRLSGDGKTSCATCHKPERAFADGLARSSGRDGRPLPRNTPTVLNSSYNALQFWDGRADTLESQARGPLLSLREMNMSDEATVMRAVAADAETVAGFQAAFGEEPTFGRLCQAIASYERTLVTTATPYDRYMRGEKKALTDPQKRGLFLFFGKASCTQCHNGPTLSDQKFHNLGLEQTGNDPADEGRAAATGRPEDRRAFRTPPLRNITLTGPFMHDGSVGTLEEVIDLYDKGGGGAAGKSVLLRPLELTAEERADLLAFLGALTGETPDGATPATPGPRVAAPASVDGREP